MKHTGIKYIIIFLAVFSSFNLLAANTYCYSDENYSLVFNYNPVIFQGDAVFAELQFTEIPKRVKKSTHSPAPAQDSVPVKARSELFFDSTIVYASDFYMLDSSNASQKNLQHLVTGIPFASWQKPGLYVLKITYSFNGQNELEFKVPVEVQEKQFKSSSSEINLKKSNNLTDTSPEKVKLTDRLNRIYSTVNPASVYNREKFQYPQLVSDAITEFSEKVTILYLNGESSSTVHKGIDFKTDEAYGIYACADGKIVLAETDDLQESIIVIEHLPGLYSYYETKGDISVKPRDSVTKETVLFANQSLHETNYLHWEIRLNGIPVNPDFFVRDFSIQKD